MEIRKRKPRTTNLRKKAIKREYTQPVSIIIKEAEPPIKKLWEGGTFSCIKCGAQEAQEFNRCRSCDAEHRQKAAELDSKPKTPVPEKMPQKLIYRKEVSRGVVVTISQTEPLRMS